MWFTITKKCDQFSSSSNTFLGRNCSKAPNVIQNGTANPKRKTNNQNAIPPNKRKRTIPNILILLYFCLVKLDGGKNNN